MKLIRMRILTPLVGVLMLLTGGQACALVTWNSVGVSNVTDDDLLIVGRCDLNNSPTPGNPVHIRATAGNIVNVTLQNDGAQEPVVYGPGLKLYLEVAPSAQICFHLDGHDLNFQGGTVLGVGQFLQIFQRGVNIADEAMGSVVFHTTAPYHLTLSSDGLATSHGVRYFVSMENGDDAVIFRRDDDTDGSTGFWLLNDSLFAFMSDTLLSSDDARNGAIVFETDNSDSLGRYELLLLNSAGFHLGGYVTDFVYTDATAVSSTWIPGGNQARLIVTSPKVSTDYTSLLVLNGNTTLSHLLSNPTRSGGYDNSTTGGAINGFVVSPNAVITLQDNTYLDYVGQTLNCDPYPPTDPDILYGRQASAICKQRNASALTIDGIESGSVGLMGVAPVINLEGNSALFFRSGKDTQNTKTTPASLRDTLVNPAFQPAGQGNIVFQVEGALSIEGAATGTHVINLLSREVYPTGGQLELGVTPVLPARFPLFTYNKYASGVNSGLYYQYAKGCFFINNSATVENLFWRHDDYTHVVSQTNFPDSQPCYIGGDTYFILKPLPTAPAGIARPEVAFINSQLRLHTSAASTGFDWQVPNNPGDNNLVRMIFYQNGRVIDQGTGRALVLGSRTGSYAYDGATVVDASSYLDIYQTTTDADTTHTLRVDLNVAPNDHSENEDIPVGADITAQTSIQTIYLGDKSNIQVGTQATQIPPLPTPTLYPSLNIDGNYFSFMTQGGTIGQPSLGGSTGEGAMFIDQHGSVSISSVSRANFSMMVVKGDETSIVDLPKCRAFFNDAVGTTFWELDLSQKQVVIDSDQRLSQFTVDWMATKKDFVGDGAGNYWRPFEPRGCFCTAVTEHTLYHIPTVRGEVDEFQFKRSRLGDQAHLLVEGGWVRELVFLKGFDSAEASTGLLAVRDLTVGGVSRPGRVAIGNNETNRETIDATVVLGVNGLTIVADGDGIVEFKTDIVINNICHILAGPNFGTGSGPNALYLYSEEPRDLRVKKGGVLDLSTFDSSAKQLVIDGHINVIFEPGSKLIMAGGGHLFVSGNSEVRLEAIAKSLGGPASFGDDDRVRWAGGRADSPAVVTFDEEAKFLIREGAVCGIETDPDGTGSQTNYRLEINDSAVMSLGSEGFYGGTFQVGDPAASSRHIGFELSINGIGATVEIGARGFLGFAGGTTPTPLNRDSETPNDWTIGRLYNVDTITMTLTEGTIRHNSIHKGTSTEASLFVVGPVSTSYNVLFPGTGGLNNMNIFGGGNMFLLGASDTAVNPTVLAVDAANVGIFSSQPILLDPSKQALLINPMTPTQFFEYWRERSALGMNSPRASFAAVTISKNKMVYVLDGAINRDPVTGIIGGLGQYAAPSDSLETGAVGLKIDATNHLINQVWEVVGPQQSAA